ncbi:hypothetical protein BP5796_01735 [Coleophoma crateriformis]|uniref:Uncharacterized protein n=1 Tax=Coleophoma crateriformis TaxID=565419 RepID=A0A3D8T1Q1_9HELO|nr:hypothetical protein BP5796_01735 [Coleophoma crateriformis]
MALTSSTTSLRRGSHSSELTKVLPSTLYLTFNAPEVNDYHRALFISSPSASDPPTNDGTLFHSVYANKTWSFERREVRNLAASKKLVLMYCISTLPCGVGADTVERVLQGIKLEHRGREGGNASLGGYSCVLWSFDALQALVENGLISLPPGTGVGNILQHAREMAGPDDARTMVGQDFGGVRVMNH